MKLSSIFSIAIVLAACTVASADILLTNVTVYTQNFNTMSALTNGSTSTLMPADWSFIESGGGANTTYATSDGGTTTGNTFSLGTNLATDRALGQIDITGVSAVSTIFGAEFQNAGPQNMTKIKSITYTGEQWRNGTATAADRLDFQYSLDATSLTTGFWNDLNTLDFTSPVFAGGAAALDGNLAANQTFKSLPKTAFASPVAPGGTFWIRWVSSDQGTGTDDALGIDNFSIQAIPEPSSIALCSLIFGAMGIGLVRRRRRVAS